MNGRIILKWILDKWCMDSVSVCPAQDLRAAFVNMLMNLRFPHMQQEASDHMSCRRLVKVKVYIGAVSFSSFTVQYYYAITEVLLDG
jgi:hypothetical protein